MKFINRIYLKLIFLLFFAMNSQAQEDKVNHDVDLSVNTKLSRSRIPIDGVAAMVGEYIILDSDIDKSYYEKVAEGDSIEDIPRCEMLGKLLEDRLYAHQATQDSIIVKDAEINVMLDQRLEYIVEQLGSINDVVKFYKKNSIEEFRAEFFDILKLQKLTMEMQRKIVDAVEITPEEVRQFFKSIPENELPYFGTELEIAQIVVNPKITEADKQKAIDKLKELKAEVLAGGSFFSKAVLYSEDPGTRSSGGFIKVTKKSGLIKEFKDVAYSLNEGEISEPFETDFGFHIIYLEKIRGQELDIRHILIAPKITDEALKEAKQKIMLIRDRIMAKELTFEEAARDFSDEKETRYNGGVLINPKTMETHFELTRLDPVLYKQIGNLKDGDISFPILDTDPYHNNKKKYKIITVSNRFEEHKADYVRDYIKIKELALNKKQIKAIEKWSAEKINTTYIKINGEYRDCIFVNNWLKK